MTRQYWHYLVGQAGERAGFGAVHLHILRHSTGHILADAGTDTDSRLLQEILDRKDMLDDEAVPLALSVEPRDLRRTGQILGAWDGARYPHPAPQADRGAGQRA